jgi:hypothetical protein
MTEDGARRYHKHWQDRVNFGCISHDQAVKRVRHLRQIIDEYHELAETLPSQKFNPMAGFKIQAPPKKNKSSNKGGKPALPKAWVKSFICGKLAEGIVTDERIDARIVIAETGCRQAEIIRIPPEDIILDDSIPHLRIRYVEEGEYARDIRNTASIRPMNRPLFAGDPEVRTVGHGKEQTWKQILIRNARTGRADGVRASG